MSVLKRIYTDNNYIFNTLSYDSINDMINDSILESGVFVKIGYYNYIISNEQLHSSYSIKLSNGLYANYMINDIVYVGALNCFDGNNNNASIINNILSSFDNITLIFDLSDLNIENRILIPSSKNISVDFSNCRIYSTNSITNGVIIGDTFNSNYVKENRRITVKNGIIDCENILTGIQISNVQRVTLDSIKIINVNQTNSRGIKLINDEINSTDVLMKNGIICGQNSFINNTTIGIDMGASDNEVINYRINGVGKCIYAHNGYQTFSNIHMLGVAYESYTPTQSTLSSNVGMELINGIYTLIECYFDQCGRGLVVSDNVNVQATNCEWYYYSNNAISNYNCIRLNNTDLDSDYTISIVNSTLQLPDTGDNYIIYCVNEAFYNGVTRTNIIQLSNNSYSENGYRYDLAYSTILNNYQIIKPYTDYVTTMTIGNDYIVGLIKINTYGYYKIDVSNIGYFWTKIKIQYNNSGITLLSKEVIYGNTYAKNISLDFVNQYQINGVNHAFMCLKKTISESDNGLSPMFKIKQYGQGNVFMKNQQNEAQLLEVTSTQLTLSLGD